MESRASGMKLKLIQAGGFAGLTKSSQKEVDLTEQEIEDLMSSLTPEAPDKSRDALSHVLMVGDNRKISFSPEEIQGKWKPLIDQMLSELEFKKRTE